MTQTQLLLDLFRTSYLSVAFSVVLFIAVYSYYAAWWNDPIGRTLVWKDWLIFLALVPGILSLFFQFSRLTSFIAGWFDVGVFFLISLTLIWRTILFRQIHNGTYKERRWIRRALKKLFKFPY